MSLWSVPDKETKEFMVLFYQNLLSGKMGKIQAFRNAALQQKEVVTQRYGEPFPFYWAAFVFLGEPGETQTVSPDTTEANAENKPEPVKETLPVEPVKARKAGATCFVSTAMEDQ